MAKQDGNPYENLANAIIINACNDYRNALKKIKRNPNNKDALSEALVWIIAREYNRKTKSY